MYGLRGVENRIRIVPCRLFDVHKISLFLTVGWTMAEQDIVIYHHPNPEMKSFLLSEEISAPRVEHLKKPLTNEARASLKSLGVLGAQVAEEIMALSGVEALQIKPKEIRVKKEVSASWEDIQGKVLDILRKALRRKQMKIVRR